MRISRPNPLSWAHNRDQINTFDSEFPWSVWVFIIIFAEATIYEPSIQNTIFALESMVGALDDFAWSFIL